MANSLATSIEQVSYQKGVPTVQVPAISELRVTGQGTATSEEQRLLDEWLAIQSINVTRHAKSLRPFTKDEFGTGPASPSEAHIEATNRFIDHFRRQVIEMSRWVDAAAILARRQPTSHNIEILLKRKETVTKSVLYVEELWDFYFDLFVQRLSNFGEKLRATDRIAANCYEDIYLGLGTAQPTPTVLPFCYAHAGYSPATFRRNVPLKKLRRNPNPFPLLLLPQHRLSDVWSLSSILHEVSHNLQADLGLWEVMPIRIRDRLITEGHIPPGIAQVWARWHKETMADLIALLLGGPATILSLMDVVGRSPASTVPFNPLSVHPTPYLRVFINLILLQRMGFDKMAAKIQRVWQRLYPRITSADIAPDFLKVFAPAATMVVDTMVFQPYPQLGGKTIAQLIEFGPKQMETIELAGRRLAAGQDPGAIPVRFMISAARFALSQNLATPQAITDNFYSILGRR